MSKFFCVLSSLLLFPLLHAQESIQSIISYPGLPKITQNRLKASLANTDTLKLPFFEDFSDAAAHGFAPNPKKWMSGSNVYVNNTFGLLPVSIGVATFDAIGPDGKLYPQALAGGVFGADTLTSLPFDLTFFDQANNANIYYRPSDSIYMSFFYQPGGFGEKPDPNDWLILEFYSPDDSIWEQVWHTEGVGPGSVYNDTIRFTEVKISINKEKWLKPGFSFRFINLASIVAVGADPGKNTNGDIWNLDYIYINKNRTFNDKANRYEVAVISKPNSLIKNFESMPWWQYKIAFSEEQLKNIVVPVYNHRPDSIEIRGTIAVKELYTNVEYEPVTNNQIKIYADTVSLYEDDFLGLRSTVAKDSVKFEIRFSIFADNFDNQQNNSVVYYQGMSNYFAYDDSTAEFGYGISGEGAANAMLALRFETYREDTLTAVSMYFNESLADKSNMSKNFYLTIWDEKNNLPGDTLFKKNNGYTYTPGWNIFKLDSAIVVPKTFYVGWVQNSSYFANLGFDRNRTARSKTFYNIQGTAAGWKRSAFDGAVMIRPIMTYNPNTVNITPQNTSIKIYPNPATSFISVEIPENMQGSEFNVHFSNLTGTVNLYKKTTGDMIDISGMQPGIYLLKISGPNGFSAVSKIIKQAR